MAEQWSAGEEPEKQAPQPMLAEPELEAEAQSSGKAGWIVSALAGIALLAGVGYSTGLFAPNSGPAPAPTAVTMTAPAQQQGFSMLQPVSAGDQGSALQGLLMSDSDKSNVAKAVQGGGTRLAWLAVSDSGAEDGDVVTISGAGFSQTVPLLKQQTRLAVPYTPGTPIRVIGTKDGYSPGITVAVYVGGNVFRLKTMREGEIIEIASP